MDNEFFNAWTSKFKSITGLGLNETEKEEWLKRKDLERCVKYKDELIKKSPLIIFLLDHLNHLGVNIRKDAINCYDCDERKGGGFSPTHGVLLCSNRLFNLKNLEYTLAHELLHAYDHHNFKVDWNNLKHHACSEIRAANLSGDCKAFNEFKRGNFGFKQHHQECVRRRAILSVSANPQCKSIEQAQSIVNLVFESCFKDTRPFDEIF